MSCSRRARRFHSALADRPLGPGRQAQVGWAGWQPHEPARYFITRARVNQVVWQKASEAGWIHCGGHEHFNNVDNVVVTTTPTCVMRHNVTAAIDPLVFLNKMWLKKLKMQWEQ